MINPSSLDSPISHHLDKVLLEIVDEIRGRPAKGVRAILVESGFLLCSSTLPTAANQKHLREFAELIENIHNGSLVIDDIQDGSKVRRGKTSLHELYGVPLALNAGNWLYFWPLQRLASIGLSQQNELRAYHAIHETLVSAHYGQALDLGIRIDEVDQSEVAGICMTAIRLKTGALMSLALRLGAILAGATKTQEQLISSLGFDLGCALQMLDDIGTIQLPHEHPKRFEDLKLRRPSWLWKVISEDLSSIEYQEFKEIVSELPDSSKLEAWFSNSNTPQRATQQAVAFLNLSTAQFKERLSAEPIYRFEAVQSGIMKLQ